MSLESFFHKVISPQRSWYLLPVYGLLRLVSVFYSFALGTRAWLYQRKIFQTRRLDCRVISIGNLTLGGTGKTPMVMMVADRLRREGFKPAILSRGYGGHSTQPVNVVCDGTHTLLLPIAVGDEPVMMARRLRTIPVLTGRDRYETGLYAIEHFGVNVLILDDGYQHLALHRDLNILLCDDARPFGNGVVFPAGELREPLDAIQRADVICRTRCHEASNSDRMEACNTRSVPVIKTGLRVQSVIDLSSGAESGIETVQRQPAGAFCGIAHPLDFFHTLEQVPVEIVNQKFFPDHHHYSTDDLKTMENQAKQAGAKLIVTTEKDAVKLQHHKFELPAYAVRIELEILEGQEELNRLLLDEA